jgi:hypothetical protein
MATFRPDSGKKIRLNQCVKVIAKKEVPTKSA